MLVERVLQILRSCEGGVGRRSTLRANPQIPKQADMHATTQGCPYKCTRAQMGGWGSTRMSFEHRRLHYCARLYMKLKVLLLFLLSWRSVCAMGALDRVHVRVGACAYTLAYNMSMPLQWVHSPPK